MDDANEEWRVLPGFINYEVSNLGRLRDTGGRFVGGEAQDGEVLVALRFGAAKAKRRLAQLVLEAFMGPRPKCAHIRYLDENPGNLHADNLAWEIAVEDRLTPDGMKDIRRARGKISVRRLALMYGATRDEIRAILGAG